MNVCTLCAPSVNAHLPLIRNNIGPLIMGTTIGYAVCTIINPSFLIIKIIIIVTSVLLSKAFFSRPASSQGVSARIVASVAAPLTLANSPEAIAARPRETYVKPSLPIDLPSYQALDKEIAKINRNFDETVGMSQIRATLYVIDATGKHQETLLRVLGRGGSKKAIQLARGRALIVPNMDADPLLEIANRWERMVLEEVAMSNILKRIGLLSPVLEQVSIALEESSEHVIPTYVCESFESLAKTKGCFIIDRRNRGSSTWTRGHSLFKPSTDRFQETNWDPVLALLIADIVQIYLHDLPVGGDSLNFAILQNPAESADLCSYQVRYFGFDFSSKHEATGIPEIQEKPLVRPNEVWVKNLIESSLDYVFSYEFGNEYDFEHPGVGEESRRFKNRLVKRYTQQVLAKCHPQV